MDAFDLIKKIGQKVEYVHPVYKRVFSGMLESVKVSKENGIDNPFISIRDGRYSESHSYELIKESMKFVK